MDNLEKILAGLPKPKLKLKADLKIKVKLYYLIFLKGLRKIIGQSMPPRRFYKNALVIALVLIMIFTGTSLYAYSSGGVTPGSRLYFLKKTVEKMEEQTSFTPAAKSRTYQKFSQRRLEEALRLSEQNYSGEQTSGEIKEQASQSIRQSIDEAVANLAVAASSAAAIKNQLKAQAAKDQITNHASSEARYLNKIENLASSANDQPILERINQAQTALSQYQNTSFEQTRPEPEEKNLNQPNTNITVPAEEINHLKSSQKNRQNRPAPKAYPRQRQEQKTDNEHDEQKPAAQVRGVRIDSSSEEYQPPAATSSPSVVNRSEESEPEQESDETQTDEQTKPAGPAPQPAPANNSQTIQQPLDQEETSDEHEEDARPSGASGSSSAAPTGANPISAAPASDSQEKTSSGDNDDTEEIKSDNHDSSESESEREEDDD